MNNELKTTLDRAKIELLSNEHSVFLSTVLFSLKIVWDDTLCPPTAGVDGKTIYIHPQFWLKLTLGERIFLLAHEAWHVAFGHIIVPEHINKEKHNIAADHVINLMLTSLPDKPGCAKYIMPAGGMCDTQYRGLCTMEVYELLGDIETTNIHTAGIGADIKSPDAGAKDIEQIEAEIQEILLTASTMHKLQDKGNLPGEIEVLIEKLVNPILPWENILQNYTSQFAKNDYSYKKPNRRYLPDLFLPTLCGESMGEIVVARDTSGSVYDTELAAFMAESSAIKERLKPSLMTILDFDCSIRNVYKFTADDYMGNLPCKGRGGTDLQCVFDYCLKNPPELLIIFSDLCCDVIQTKPPYPVIWVCVSNPTATVKFGKLIHLTI